MDDSQATSAESNIVAAARHAPRFRAARCLLADGNRLTQRIAVRLLQTDGHDLTSVSTGEQLVAALRQNVFDLLIMDIDMLDVTVGEVVAMVQEQVNSKKYPLSTVAMTSNKLQGERCLQAGMSRYIVKPLNLAELRRVIASTIPATEAAPAFDLASALARVNGDQSFLCTLATIFIEESPAQLNEVRLAIEQHDGRMLSRAAHKLKGSAYPFSATDLCRLMQTLESIGESGQLDGAADKYQQSATACGRLQTALAEMLSPVDGRQVSTPGTLAGPEGTIPCTV